MQWFSSEEVKLIELGDYDLRILFENNEESWHKMKEFPIQF
jgi:hypothetical protein